MLPILRMYLQLSKPLDRLCVYVLKNFYSMLCYSGSHSLPVIPHLVNGPFLLLSFEHSLPRVFTPKFASAYGSFALMTGWWHLSVHECISSGSPYLQSLHSAGYGFFMFNPLSYHTFKTANYMYIFLSIILINFKYKSLTNPLNC